MEREIYSVSELNNTLKAFIEGSELFADICVYGEISNYKLYPSGHHYFTLKDSESSLSCVMFKGSAFSLRFRPENGLGVIAAGRISVYQRDGKYQLICSHLHPAGAGDLQLAFEQLKASLEKEGLFDSCYKKPLPEFPKKIALITSGSGAAVHDMIRILGERWKASAVLVVPVRVQGSEAPGEISDAISYVNRYSLADLIITGRGGGSLEDLWAFNTEIVARAIFASQIPVISAVGHEPDVTISDYVADRRASTPSNAAEIAVPDFREMKGVISGYEMRMKANLLSILEKKRSSLKLLAEKPVMKNIDVFFGMRRMELDSYQSRLQRLMEITMEAASGRLSRLSASLDAMSPLKVLSRGYSVATGISGKAVKSISDIKSKEKINLRLADGAALCTVEEIYGR